MDFGPYTICNQCKGGIVQLIDLPLMDKLVCNVKYNQLVAQEIQKSKYKNRFKKRIWGLVQKYCNLNLDSNQLYADLEDMYMKSRQFDQNYDPTHPDSGKNYSIESYIFGLLPSYLRNIEQDIQDRYETLRYKSLDAPVSNSPEGDDTRTIGDMQTDNQSLSAFHINIKNSFKDILIDMTILQLKTEVNIVKLLATDEIKETTTTTAKLTQSAIYDDELIFGGHQKGNRQKSGMRKMIISNPMTLDTIKSFYELLDIYNISPRYLITADPDELNARFNVKFIEGCSSFEEWFNKDYKETQETTPDEVIQADIWGLIPLEGIHTKRSYNIQEIQNNFIGAIDTLSREDLEKIGTSDPDKLPEIKKMVIEKLDKNEPTYVYKEYDDKQQALTDIQEVKARIEDIKVSLLLGKHLSDGTTITNNDKEYLQAELKNLDKKLMTLDLTLKNKNVIDYKERVVRINEEDKQVIEAIKQALTTPKNKTYIKTHELAEMMATIANKAEVQSMIHNIVYRVGSKQTNFKYLTDNNGFILRGGTSDYKSRYVIHNETMLVHKSGYLLDLSNYNITSLYEKIVDTREFFDVLRQTHL